MSGISATFVDNLARVVSGLFFTAGAFQMLNPVGATRFFGFEDATESESKLLPVVAGRNLTIGLALLNFSFTNDRRAFGVLATSIVIAGMSDVYAVWAYGGKKIGGHLVGTCTFTAVGALVLMNS